LDTNLKKLQSRDGKSKDTASSHVSIDLTLDTCMESFWKDAKRPAPSLVKLKAKTTIHHSQSVQTHLQEHAIRLSLHANAQKNQMFDAIASDIRTFANFPSNAKTSIPTGQFYGSALEGLPALPPGTNVFNSSSVEQTEYFKIAKKYKDTFEKLKNIGVRIAKPTTSAIETKKTEVRVEKAANQVAKKPVIENLLESFPAHLRPAVIELSKAIACLSSQELDVLVESTDWRTRKLIRMVAAAKLRA